MRTSKVEKKSQQGTQEARVSVTQTPEINP